MAKKKETIKTTIRIVLPLMKAVRSVSFLIAKAEAAAKNEIRVTKERAIYSILDKEKTRTSAFSRIDKEKKIKIPRTKGV